MKNGYMLNFKYIFVLTAMLAALGCTKKTINETFIEIEVPESAKERTLNVLSYNIYEGMIKDESEGKEKFVSWVISQHPDVFIMQEVRKISGEALAEMAYRWGHGYSVMSKQTGYPVAITSKYPLSDVEIVNENITHGCIYAKIEGYNFIALHLNPHHEKNRIQEIKLILEQLVKSKPDEKKWIIAGDFNSISPLDAKNIPGRNYEVHNTILEAGFIDAQKYKYSEFISTCPTVGFSTSYPLRYDFIYVSDKLRSSLKDVWVIKDNFTDKYSDHYPLKIQLVDFIKSNKE